MKLAVSNIAWPIEIEEQCLDVLQKNNISFLEVAPTKYWADLTSVNSADIREKQVEIRNHNMEVVSAQSLLFGKPDLRIFGDDAEVNKTIEYLKSVIDVCSEMGCKALVFGSPKNRIKGIRSFDEALSEITPVFRELGRYCSSKGTTFCIEPNATAYGCDFVTNVDEAIRVVEAIATEGFGLHLDVGNMIMAGENVADSIAKAGDLIKHFHISAPQLAPVEELKKYLSRKDWAQILTVSTYLSIEMLIKSEVKDVPGILDRNISYMNATLTAI